MRLWKFARWLNYLYGSSTKPRKRRPPRPLWKHLTRTLRREELACGHRLRLAADHERRMMVDQVSRLIDRLEEFRSELLAEARPRFPSIRALYEELLALHEAFGEVLFDGDDVSVVTRPIVLHRVNFGRFEIRLNSTRLYKVFPFIVIAREPQAAAGDSDVVHPHVHGRRLEEGDEAEERISAALREGRLFDFFQLVVQALRTFDPQRTLVPISDWSVRCKECQASLGSNDEEEDDETCHGCRMPICGACARQCFACQEVLCQQCLEAGNCLCFRREMES